MTTTQIGGGNGAAPDGGSERIVPDAPGWWWADFTDITGLVSREVVEVYRAEGHGDRLFIYDKNIVDRADHEWLAPIPGPAVCAALAEYGAAVDDLDALWDGADFITRNNVTNLAHAAGDALDAAIRAERDAERDGAA